MMNEYQIGKLKIIVPHEWKDITDSLGEENIPFTLARDSGIGAFQFSVFEHEGGKNPFVNLDDLNDLRSKFTTGRNFPQALEEESLGDVMMISMGSYHVGDDYVVVWYCSDGENIVLATYVSVWIGRNDEASECDGFVREMRFLT